MVSQETYHLVALSVAGTIAGIATLAGIALLIYRRRTTGPVFLATTRNDKLMYVVLGGGDRAGPGRDADRWPLPGPATEHNYRETVSIWFRSLLVLPARRRGDGRQPPGSSRCTC